MNLYPKTEPQEINYVKDMHNMMSKNLHSLHIPVVREQWLETSSSS